MQTTATSWALPPDTLDYIEGLCDKVQPRHIVEFGSGRSTSMFARYCRRSGNCRVTSFEHDPMFRDQLLTQLELAGLQDVAKVNLAPLVMRKIGEQLLPVYQIDATLVVEPAQIILIDGPPLKLGGRQGTLYLAMNWAEPGTVVLLDDAERDDEAASLKSWEDEFGDVIEVSHPQGLTRGIASIVVKEAVPMDQVWDRRVARAVGEISSVVPPESSLILVDDDAWNLGSHVSGRTRFHLTDAGGAYNGPPADSSAALAEVEQRRHEGVEFLAVGWPAFWWLDQYPQLAHYLREKMIFRSSRVVVYRL